MAIYASHVPYLLSNFASREDINEVLALANQRMSQSLKNHVETCLRRDGADAFINNWQPRMAGTCAGMVFTFAEMAEMAANEITPQVILAESLKGILLGPSGLVHRTGGGYCNLLLQDVQIGFVRDIYNPQDNRGPVIMSGRNRFLGVQALFLLASPGCDVGSIKMRCMAYNFNTSAQLEESIIAANSGRDFPAAERNDKRAAGRGMDLTSRDGIRNTINADKLPRREYRVALGAWLRLHAAENGYNGLSSSQVADGGRSLYAMLEKQVKPAGGTVNKWFGEDTSRLIHLCEVLEPVLEGSMLAADKDPAQGRKSSKLAQQLLPTALRVFPAL